ncbi:MAG: hypothetical protein M3N39_00700 [Pseudomonadota bacterium]|nr:hypothetical protein [Pseudomonadota bacterium]
MSFSSAEVGPTYRGACNLVPVLVALLLAWLSTSMNVPDEPRAARESLVAAGAATRPMQGAVAGEDAHGLRGVFAAPEGDPEARSYHPTFQTSDSTGVLGFWMLVSLCALLLGAALAPLAIQWLWRHGPMRWFNNARHQG